MSELSPRGPGYEFYDAIAKTGETVTIECPSTIPAATAIYCQLQGEGVEKTIYATYTGGILKANFAPADFNGAGVYRAEFALIGSDGKIHLEPDDGSLHILLQAGLLESIEPPPSPPEFIEITPGDNLQIEVLAGGMGAKFLFKSGTYVGASIIPMEGQTFQAETGVVFDGNNFATKYAFWTGLTEPFPNNVQIKGFKITGYEADEQMGAIRAGGHFPNEGSIGWLIEDCEVAFNHESGIRIGNATIVRDCNLHHNQRLNVGGAGDNALIENSTIAYGNYEGAFDPGFEAGGAKFAVCNGVIVRGCNVHHNNGPAVWFDERATNMLVENNNVHDNNTEGIVIEIAYDAIIRNNTVTDNGHNDPNNRYTYGWNAGIGIHSSPDCEVYGNTLSGNYNGICAIQQDRTTSPIPPGYGAHEVRNLNVHDNSITHSTVAVGVDNISLASGVMKDFGPDDIFTTWGNQFSDNTYVYGEETHPHAWMNGLRTPAEWAAYGQE